jgi:hypothetical protein
MIEAIRPATRKLLLRCRLKAMSGEKAVAIEELRKMLDLASTANDFPLLEDVALRMLIAEILYLDGQEQEAFDILKSENI